MPRAALFLDFENLYTTLKRRTAGARNPYGFSPRMDFAALVRYIEERYGTLAREDFIAVANFTHYNPQLGGLNKVATVIDAQSFMGPQVRRRVQRSHGKKWVIRNFADMRLAFEIGRHMATRPADVYILGSGDEAFTALGRTLRDQGFQVVFLVADTQSPATDANILAEFDVIDFLVTQPEPGPEPETPTPTAATEVEAAATNPAEHAAALVATLRRELRTGIPVNLVVALLGLPHGPQWVDQAAGQGLVDLWDSPEGVRCVSLQQERVFGQVQKLSVRPAVDEAGRVFFAVASLAQHLPPHPDRAFWRKGLRQQLGLSNRKAKALLQRLLAAGVLHDAHLHQPQLTMVTLARFLRQGP